MYSGHIIIQGCQLWPFEGNKYLPLHTSHHLNFVWTHGCNECHSPSFIHLASLRSRCFIQIKTIKREKSCRCWCGPITGHLFGVSHSLQGGLKIICWRKDDGWQIKTVSRNWRWVVTEVFILRMEAGVRWGWTPKGTRRTRPTAWGFSLFWILATRSCKEIIFPASAPACSLLFFDSFSTMFVQAPWATGKFWVCGLI